MGFFSSLRSELIDIIEWLDDSNNTIVYRFERHDNEIKNGAKLIVREGQAAVFINEGKIADVFSPGTYELSTQNLPLLSTLKGWKYGFDSPFKAEVYFVSTRNITAQKWGTKNPIMLSDQRFGLLEIRAFGSYVYNVTEPSTFITEIVGTDGHFTTDEIADHLKSLIVTRFTDAVGEAGLPVEAFAANTNELSEFVLNTILSEFAEYGITLSKFFVENVSMPDDVKQEIFELSRANTINLDNYGKLKSIKAMEAAAENPNGLAGAGVGAGMGFAMANQMSQTMYSNQPPQQAQPTATPPTPPPIPTAVTFFAVVNGQQAGPFTLDIFSQMATQNQITRDTLVWREGMANWAKASEVTELQSVFGNVPPPIPEM